MTGQCPEQHAVGQRDDTDQCTQGRIRQCLRQFVGVVDELVAMGDVHLGDEIVYLQFIRHVTWSLIGFFVGQHFWSLNTPGEIVPGALRARSVCLSSEQVQSHAPNGSDG